MLGKCSRVGSSANGAAQISTRLETKVSRHVGITSCDWILVSYINRPVSERVLPASSLLLFMRAFSELRDWINRRWNHLDVSKSGGLSNVSISFKEFLEQSKLLTLLSHPLSNFVSGLSSVLNLRVFLFAKLHETMPPVSVLDGHIHFMELIVP